MNMKNKFLPTILIILLVASILVGCDEIPVEPTKETKISRFKSIISFYLTYKK